MRRRRSAGGTDDSFSEFLHRPGEGREAAELALATGASDFLAGQVIPVSGGWAT